MIKLTLGIVCFIDICTRLRMSSKNVDLNICAHTGHSVSVMGYKQGFELAVHVLFLVILQVFQLLNQSNRQILVNNKKTNLKGVQSVYVF